MPANIDRLFARFQNGEIYRGVLDTLERSLIEKALERAFGNRNIASRILGLNRNTLRTKIQKLNIDVERFKL